MSTGGTESLRDVIFITAGKRQCSLRTGRHGEIAVCDHARRKRKGDAAVTVERSPQLEREAKNISKRSAKMPTKKVKILIKSSMVLKINDL
jgi:hypothetical protein